ncbi:MAG: hypothetical protein QOJ03_2037 [Frankiaceae bacterium]|jgi:capsular polysaccharide biosynthesis protein|nr:hypothetical protein [Frankiaceae bacterium]
MADDPDSQPSPLRQRRKTAAATQTATSTATPTEAVARPRRPPVATTSVADVPVVAAEPVVPEPSRPRPSVRFWAILVASALVVGLAVGAVAAYAVKHSSPTFQSQALLEIDQAHALASSPDDGVMAKLSRLRYKYAGLIRTEVFAKPVATNTNLSRGVVNNALYAVVDPSSLLLAVGARANTADKAQSIANAASQQLVDFARTEQETNKIPVTLRVTFTIVTPADTVGKVSPTQRRIDLVALGAFLFVAAGTIGFGYLWRRDS